jgi:hypothetical protein
VSADRLPLVVAITGASGAPYAVRLIESLASSASPTWLIVSAHGLRLLDTEMGIGSVEARRERVGASAPLVAITRALGLKRTRVSAFRAPSVITTVSPEESLWGAKVKCIGVPELVPHRSSGDDSQRYLFSPAERSFACNLS